MAQAASLTGTGTAAVILDPTAKTTTVAFSASAGSSGTVQVEMTLDDPTAVPLGGPAITWALLSSATAMISSNVTSLVYTVLTPIGGVRINSTSNSGTSVYTLRALQSKTA